MEIRVAYYVVCTGAAMGFLFGLAWPKEAHRIAKILLSIAAVSSLVLALMRLFSDVPFKFSLLAQYVVLLWMPYLVLQLGRGLGRFCRR